MLAVVLIAALGLGAPEAWLAPSLVDPLDPQGTRPTVFDDSPAAVNVRNRPDLAAARGERESVLLFLRADDEALEGLTVRADAPAADIAAPEIRLLLPAARDRHGPRALRTGGPFLDVLAPMRPHALAPGAMMAYWLTYTIPRDAAPGDHRHEVAVFSGEASVATLEVHLRIYGFALPETPALPALFGLDRSAMARALGAPPASVEAWQPLYARLLRERIALSLTDGGVLVDPGGLQAHLDAAMATHPMAAIDLGGYDGAVFSQLLPPPSPDRPDLARFLVDEMAGWLEERGWLGRACLSLGPLPPREAWDEARALCERAGGPVPRLVAGAPHDGLAGYVETWAVTAARYSPSLLARLSRGLGLRAYAVPEVLACEVSQGKRIPALYVEEPAALDVCDGSLHTQWTTPTTPSGTNPVTLVVHYAEPVTAETLTVVWESGAEATDLEVSTAYDGHTFSRATTRWEHRGPVEPYDNSRSTGELKYEKTFLALRLRIGDSVGRRPVGIVEVLPGDMPTAPLEEGTPAAAWLWVRPGAFPALDLDAHPAEARLLPWVCHAQGFTGILGPRVNPWPRDWKAPVAPAEYASGLDADASQSLAYPGETGLYGSVRMERLRDGLEDYDYLRLLVAHLQSTPEGDPARTALLQLPPFPRRPTARHLADWAGLVLQRREAIAEVLGAAAAP